MADSVTNMHTSLVLLTNIMRFYPTNKSNSPIFPKSSKHSKQSNVINQKYNKFLNNYHNNNSRKYTIKQP